MTTRRGRTHVSVTMRGAIVEGKTAKPAADLIRAIDKAVAEDTKDTWFRLLRKSVRKWTGAYGRTIKVKHTAKQSIVSDFGAQPYGPWLEGTSRRNRATRFKGYHALKRARAEVQQRAGKIGEKVTAKHLKDFS